MIAIHLDKVSVTYISEPIFENLSWEIHDDRVAGLVGPNGCGKSTLLKLLHGDLTSDTGFVVRQPDLTVGYLTQEPDLNPENTVWEEVITANQALAEIEAELTGIESQLADPEVYGDEKRLARLLDHQARLLENFTASGGPGYAGHVRSILRSLGFSEPDFPLPVEALSGGQKKLVGLAKLLILRPKMLLLDEPDNHLDLAGKDFLANFIRNYPGAVVIVSHDRYLLDLVVDEIIDLEDGKLKVTRAIIQSMPSISKPVYCASSNSFKPSRKRLPAWNNPRNACSPGGNCMTTKNLSNAARIFSNAWIAWINLTVRCWNANAWGWSFPVGEAATRC